MALHYQDGVTADDILAEARRFAAQFEQNFLERKFANVTNPERRLRIGYVSADFREHSVARFLKPLLLARDHEAFEVFCYSAVVNPDSMTRQFQGLADHWRNATGLSDGNLAEKIHDDCIDILVDLGGHTAGNRLPMFARKPAPIQVTWLGFPGTTGLASIDYRLVDPITDPQDNGDDLASETLFRLADGFLCYGPPDDSPTILEERHLNTTLTFGSFNNPAKLSATTIDTWSALLAQLPHARLLLKGRPFDDATGRARFLNAFLHRGIDRERIDFVGYLSSSTEHLALYRQVDIALDPFPYNGTTTTCEALWMGVPVVTLCGDRHSGRVGASLVTQLGLRELIARDVQHYVDIAAALAADRKRLAELRLGLRRRMAASSLCDGPAFARKIEAAYRTMWRMWCTTGNG